MKVEKEPFYECPSYPICSAPVCPLDPNMNQHFRLDTEEECRSSRPTRERIAAKYPGLLPTNGLKPKEVNRDKRRAAFLALPVEERERRLAKLKPFKRDGLPR